MKKTKLILFLLLLLFFGKAWSQASIFVTIAGGDLYKLNLATCNSTLVGSTGQGFGDIAFTQNGKLWGIVNGNLYRIDTTNANISLIGSTGMQPVSLVGLNDTTVLTEFNQNLYGIRTVDASTYYIGNIGYQASGDLTWYDDNLYMTSGSLLIKITLNGGYTAIVSSSPVSTINLIPTCEGAATCKFAGSDNRIIGFASNNALKICQIDATYQMLCPGIVPGSIPGGASVRLATQNPTPNSCPDIVGIYEQTEKQFGFVIAPNPFNNETSIFLDSRLQNPELILFNSLGQVIRTQNSIKENKIQLNLENCPPGVYFLQIKEGDNITLFSKLIKIN